MRAEIISIGTELLLGQIVNTNARFLATELQELGIESYFQTTVGDNPDRIHYVLNEALRRSNLIITTGGLGPTSDDLTHEAIASFFKVKPVEDKKVLEEIKKRFALRGYKKMPAMNKKQAYKPKEAKWIPNKFGTANGIAWKVNNQQLIMTFPGVPKEMIQMWSDSAKPYLKKLVKGNILHSRTLKYTGIGESALAEKIKKYFNLKNPTVAPYASTGEVKIRVTAKAKTIKEAKRLVNKTAKEILAKTKEYYFGENEEKLEEIVAKNLISRRNTIGIAESCTGGLLSKRLTDIPGSSKYIKFNAVTYSNEAKNKILNVPIEVLKKHGAVSEETAKAMAIGIRNIAKTNIGLSITGIAGPSSGTKEKPVGLVYFGLAKGNNVKVQKVLFGSNTTRESIRFLATQFALNWLRKEI